MQEAQNKKSLKMKFKLLLVFNLSMYGHFEDFGIRASFHFQDVGIGAASRDYRILDPGTKTTMSIRLEQVYCTFQLQKIVL